MFVEYSSQLSQLACGLPERFLPCLHNLMTKLPRLFAEDWPLVPNHNDLLENNIHVEPETGEIVGICGWNNATIGPFGVSLGSIETIIGMRKLYGWCYHDNYLELRGLFWEAFYDAIGQISLEQLELIELATLVGIFLRHGFEEDDKGNMSPAKEGSVSLDYLDSVTLGIWVWTEH
jgi:hypothetical protein